MRACMSAHLFDLSQISDVRRTASGRFACKSAIAHVFVHGVHRSCCGWLVVHVGLLIQNAILLLDAILASTLYCILPLTCDSSS